MPAPQQVRELVERFERNRDSYLSSGYNETQIRREFLDPLFAALGWDVENRQGYAEAYKDVIHEDEVKIGGSTRAPDYSFRVGGTRKFFVEAKKPSVKLKDGEGSAYQLRRYAWSAKLPLSILTNFEELAVYDCRQRPSPGDAASVGRVLYVTSRELDTRWEELASIFSRDAVLKGSFDKYAATAKAKRGTTTVDKAFLGEIESWRETLAKNLALRNPKLSQRDLNYAVGKTIDRLIFLRICEDRGIETYQRLQGLVNGLGVYARLAQVFEDADARYNSGLFHFHTEKNENEAPDAWTLELSIDDKVLRDIIGGLYYPESPYEFSVLPAEILGQVYEQFLGKVIRLTAGHQAKIEDKPEDRKAGGGYYTPAYTVEYIVKNTVGKLLEGKTPKQAAKLRILDPACGSGSFLIGAYQHLMDWHRDRYVENGPAKHTKEIFQGPGGRWLLTTQEKRRILLNNIFGVDIDPQAVEVTKLSLLLKVLEGESEETLRKQFKLFHERALPDLAWNIKCGNSLIGPDFYAGQQMLLIDDDERMRVNVFDWDAEYPEIMKAGGFDAVIGNPPYVRIQTTQENDLAYLSRTFRSASGNYDVYCLFVEKGFGLLNDRGLLGYILPHRFMKTAYGEGLRGLLSQERATLSIIDFDGFMVFEQASINTCVLLLSSEARPTFAYARARFNRALGPVVHNSLEELDLGRSDQFVLSAINADRISADPWVFIGRDEESIWHKLTVNRQRLGAIARIFQGLKTGADGVFIGTLLRKKAGSSRMQYEISGTLEEREIETSILRPLAKGGEMRRYTLEESPRRILFPYRSGALIPPDELKTTFPLAWRYLRERQPDLDSREGGRFSGRLWYAYSRSQALTAMTQTKIMTPDYYAHASYCLDLEGKTFFSGGGAGGYGISVDDSHEPRFVLGLLNSALIDWFLRKISMRAYQTAYLYVKQYLEQLPICEIDPSDRPAQARLVAIVALVTEMLELNKRLSAANDPAEKTAIERQIAATDRQIDELVYELYGLTDEEIRIVEGTTS